MFPYIPKQLYFNKERTKIHLDVGKLPRFESCYSLRTRIQTIHVCEILPSNPTKRQA